MERDFLGVGVKDLAAREEAGFQGRSAVQWPFSSMVLAKQQFMNFQAAQEERAKKIMFDQLSSSGLQPMSAADVFAPGHRSASVVSQKHMGMNRQGIHQFQLPIYPAQGADPFSASPTNHAYEVRTFPVVSNNSFPTGTTGPFFMASGSINGSTAVTCLKQQFSLGGGPTVGVGSMITSFAPRNTIKSSGATAQLTIFYAGTVNVYDDVPLEKAQAIMCLADNLSNPNPNVGKINLQATTAATTKVAGIETSNMNQTQDVNQIQTLRNVTQACSVLSRPISTASHSGSQSASGSTATDDLSGATRSSLPAGNEEPSKVVTSVVSASSATLVLRAVPQARKASLTRFLEKRKERVTNVAPYPSPQKTPECSSGFDGKPVAAETAYSNSMEQSWCFSSHKNSSDSSNSLSTKLEI